MNSTPDRCYYLLRADGFVGPSFATYNSAALFAVMLTGDWSICYKE